jgi:protoheme IX farnesyltransferase
LLSVTTQALPTSFGQRLRAFYSLTKPRVVSLIVFTAVIGMLLATPGVVPLQILLAGIFGIWLVAGAAAAVNCLVEQKIDAVMSRTSWRPLPQGELSPAQTLAFAGVLGGAGLWLLHHYVNALTMWLTLATFVGYAVVYTVILKPATPQNIVIGGASGAMPPVLGWAAVTGEVTIEPLLLFLIIFAWTPPHFWSLALYRTEDYARAGVPMLPVTHGKEYTRLQVLLYTLILFAVSLLPYVVQMAGMAYLAAAATLGGIFIAYAWRIYRSYSDALAQKTFRYSIVYLAFLFAALLVDHYL